MSGPEAGVTRRSVVAGVAIAAGFTAVILLFPVMGDSRGSMSMFGTPVPSENGLVAIATGAAVAACVGGLLHTKRWSGHGSKGLGHTSR